MNVLPIEEELSLSSMANSRSCERYGGHRVKKIQRASIALTLKEDLRYF
jgi:hypothetical protein